jgi:phosphatidylserine/phosphatidylglycerophosphate/cardiolipin synthase-like enzyme
MPVASPAPKTTAPVASSAAGKTGTSTLALTWISEPQAGFSPWAAALSQVRSGVDVNDYLLTDHTYVADLIAVANRGIPVRVLLAPNPYRDAAAVTEERAEFAGSKVQLHWAPARFDGNYRFDHAKYLVVNPGTPTALAIFGSANGTASAFSGGNAEDDIESTADPVTTALTSVFASDWQNIPVGAGVRTILALSPGSQPALTALLSQPGPVDVVAEELGDVPTLYVALEAHHAQARVLVPSDASPARIAALRASRVQVRELSQPYPHGKLILTSTQTFVGSQNFSEPSMQDNREVGLITPNPAIHAAAAAWFDGLWAAAQ